MKVKSSWLVLKGNEKLWKKYSRWEVCKVTDIVQKLFYTKQTIKILLKMLNLKLVYNISVCDIQLFGLRKFLCSGSFLYLMSHYRVTGWTNLYQDQQPITSQGVEQESEVANHI